MEDFVSYQTVWFAVGEQKRTLPVSFLSAAMATILSDRSRGR
jgi:hypothetical protein